MSPSTSELLWQYAEYGKYFVGGEASDFIVLRFTPGMEDAPRAYINQVAFPTNSAFDKKRDAVSAALLPMVGGFVFVHLQRRQESLEKNLGRWYNQILLTFLPSNKIIDALKSEYDLYLTLLQEGSSPQKSGYRLTDFDQPIGRQESKTISLPKFIDADKQYDSLISAILDVIGENRVIVTGKLPVEDKLKIAYVVQRRAWPFLYPLGRDGKKIDGRAVDGFGRPYGSVLDDPASGLVSFALDFIAQPAMHPRLQFIDDSNEGVQPGWAAKTIESTQPPAVSEERKLPPWKPDWLDMDVRRRILENPDNRFLILRNLSSQSSTQTVSLHPSGLALDKLENGSVQSDQSVSRPACDGSLKSLQELAEKDPRYLRELLTKSDDKDPSISDNDLIWLITCYLQDTSLSPEDIEKIIRGRILRAQQLPSMIFTSMKEEQPGTEWIQQLWRQIENIPSLKKEEIAEEWIRAQPLILLYHFFYGIALPGLDELIGTPNIQTLVAKRLNAFFKDVEKYLTAEQKHNEAISRINKNLFLLLFKKNRSKKIEEANQKRKNTIESLFSFRDVDPEKILEKLKKTNQTRESLLRWLQSVALDVETWVSILNHIQIDESKSDSWFDLIRYKIKALEPDTPDFEKLCQAAHNWVDRLSFQSTDKQLKHKQLREIQLLSGDPEGKWQATNLEGREILYDSLLHGSSPINTISENFFRSELWPYIDKYHPKDYKEWIERYPDTALIYLLKCFSPQDMPGLVRQLKSNEGLLGVMAKQIDGFKAPGNWQDIIGGILTLACYGMDLSPNVLSKLLEVSPIKNQHVKGLVGAVCRFLRSSKDEKERKTVYDEAKKWLDPLQKRKYSNAIETAFNKSDISENLQKAIAVITIIAVIALLLIVPPVSEDPTPTPTGTTTLTATPTLTYTPSLTNSPTPTPTSTFTLTPTITPTPTLTFTSTPTSSSTPTSTSTPAPLKPLHYNVSAIPWNKQRLIYMLKKMDNAQTSYSLGEITGLTLVADPSPSPSPSPLQLSNPQDKLLLPSPLFWEPQNIAYLQKKVNEDNVLWLKSQNDKENVWAINLHSPEWIDFDTAPRIGIRNSNICIYRDNDDAKCTEIKLTSNEIGLVADQMAQDPVEILFASRSENNYLFFIIDSQPQTIWRSIKLDQALGTLESGSTEPFAQVWQDPGCTLPSLQGQTIQDLDVVVRDQNFGSDYLDEQGEESLVFLLKNTSDEFSLLWMSRDCQPVQVALADMNVKRVRWSPDGTELGFVAEASDVEGFINNPTFGECKNGCFFTLNPDTRILTWVQSVPLGISDFWWGPNADK